MREQIKTSKCYVVIMACHDFTILYVQNEIASQNCDSKSQNYGLASPNYYLISHNYDLVS